MKKIGLGVFLAIFVFITSSTAYAAEVHIKVDGVAIVSDVKPALKNNRIMVPLRVISENLGANVNWSNSEVTLTKGTMKVLLKSNSKTAVKNGTKILLDVKPYIKNNRLIVPLRFIAETFGCKVNYSNDIVMVNTAPLVINGVQIKALQQEYHMTMGGVVQQINGNVNIETVYNLFVSNIGKKVDAPAHYSWGLDLGTTPGSYYKEAQYDFIDYKGKSIAGFDIYSLGLSYFPDELLSGYPDILIHDNSKDEWHLFNETATRSIYHLIDDALTNGYRTVISNTVV